MNTMPFITYATMLDLNFQKRNQTPQNVMTMASIFGFAWFKQLNFVVAKNPPTGFFFQRTGGNVVA